MLVLILSNSIQSSVPLIRLISNQDGSQPKLISGPSAFPFPTYDPVDITDSEPDSPKICAAGSLNGLSAFAVGLLLAVIVGPTVLPVVDESLHHNRVVLVMFVSGSVDGLNDDV